MISKTIKILFLHWIFLFSLIVSCDTEKDFVDRRSILDDADSNLILPEDALIKDGSILGDDKENYAISAIMVKSDTQLSYTASLPINFHVTFSSPIDANTFTARNISNSGTATEVIWGVSDLGNQKEFIVSAEDILGREGTIEPVVTLKFIADFFGESQNEEARGSEVVTFDKTLPSVSIEQKIGQFDPTQNSQSIEFEVVFTEAISPSSFTTSDIIESGGSTGITWAIVNSGNDKNFIISATALTDGPVVPSLDEAVIFDLAGNPNTASVSVDNSITLDTQSPSVSIARKQGQATLTSSLPLEFSVTFDETINPETFDATDIIVGGSAGGVSWIVVNSGDNKIFTLLANSITTEGNLVPSIADGSISDTAGNLNEPSADLGSLVTYDVTGPSVTINQKATQADPAELLPLEFDVIFTEAIDASTFSVLDISDIGSAGGVTWNLINSGDNINFTLQATGIVTPGVVIPTLAAAVVSDLIGNFNLALVSGTSNQIEYDPNDFPIAVNDSGQLMEDDFISMSVLSNDTDLDTSDILAISAISDGAYGTVSIDSGSTSLTYTPAANFHGIDTFTYTVSDGRGGIDVGTVTVRVMNPFTWTGNGTDNNWSTSGNWCGSLVGGGCSGGGAPSTGNVAIFDGTCTSNCSATIDNSISIYGIELNTGFIGSLIQGIGNTIVVSAGGYTQSAGTFIGGDSRIAINGKFDQSGGSFSSTVGTLSIGFPSCTHITLFSTTGGIFTHNNGLLEFRGQRSSCGPANTIFTLDVDSSLVLNNVRVNGNSGTPYRSSHKVSTGDKILITGTLTHSGGEIRGEWDLSGNLVVETGAHYSSGGNITMLGSADQFFVGTPAGGTAQLTINKPSGIVQESVPTDLGVAGFFLIDGDFIAPTNTLNIGGSPYCTHTTTVTTAVGATFSHNNGTIKFSSLRSSCGPTLTIYTIDVGTTLILNNVIVGAHSQTIYKNSSSGTIKIIGDLNHAMGGLQGSWDLDGNLNVGASAFGSFDGSINFVGAGNQTYVSTGTGQTSVIKINKTSGTVQQSSATSLYLSGIDIVQGSFTAPSGVLEFGGANCFDQIVFEMTGSAAFYHNNGLTRFKNVRQSCGPTVTNYTIDVASSVSFFDVEINGGATSAKFIVMPSDIVIVDGSYIHLNSYIGGIWYLNGDVAFDSNNSTATNSSAAFTIGGAVDQRYSSLFGNHMAGLVTISKPSGSLILTSNITMGEIGTSLALEQGALDLAGFTLDIADTLTLEVGTTLTLGGGSYVSSNFIDNGAVINP